MGFSRTSMFNGDISIGIQQDLPTNLPLSRNNFVLSSSDNLEVQSLRYSISPSGNEHMFLTDYHRPTLQISDQATRIYVYTGPSQQIGEGFVINFDSLPRFAMRTSDSKITITPNGLDTCFKVEGKSRFDMIDCNNIECKGTFQSNLLLNKNYIVNTTTPSVIPLLSEGVYLCNLNCKTNHYFGIINMMRGIHVPFSQDGVTITINSNVNNNPEQTITIKLETPEPIPDPNLVQINPVDLDDIYIQVPIDLPISINFLRLL